MIKLDKIQLVYIACLVSLSILIGGVLFYWDIKNDIKEERLKDLETISQLKVYDIENWVKERKADIQVMSQSELFRGLIEQWTKSQHTPELTEKVRTRLKLSQEKYNYETVFLYTTESGILATTNDKIIPVDEHLDDIIENLLEQNEDLINDFYYCKTEGKIHFDFVAPIYSEDNSTINAFIVFRVNPEDFLYPYIKSWPTQSTTAETLLVKETQDSVIFLNELRHQENTALNLWIPMTQETLPAVMAVNGIEGIVEGVDYRNKEVYADLSPVPGTDWFMVTKIDKDEVMHYVYANGLYVLLFTLLIIFVLVLGFAWFYNSREKLTFKTLWEAEEEFKTTLYSIGDGVITTDNKGKVKHINAVAEDLTGWKENEAQRKSLEEVFEIVNEATNTKVENPVTKVLKTGKIIGLANHTVLISKKGNKSPIADSAAPIRDEKGKIIGVVLVFRDQTQERKKMAELEASRNYTKTIIETLSECLIVLDNNYVIRDANPAFCDLFYCESNNVINKQLFNIENNIFDQPELRSFLMSILSNQNNSNTIELVAPSHTSGNRYLIINAQKINFNELQNGHLLLAITDVTERHKLIRDLTKSKEKAEESDQLKTAFLANMSHEIRTPLNGIIGFSNLITEDGIDPEDKETYMKIIEGSGQRLLNIVNDILDISLIQSNQLKIKKHEFNIHEFLNELLTFYRKIMAEKLETIELVLEFEPENNSLNIYTDKDRLFQIFKNLLDNAFKITTKGAIHFGATLKDSVIKFYVKDTGTGIPAEKFDLIFDKFQQIELNHVKMKNEGTGLGLSIVKGLVNCLGGKIWLKSEVGKGSEFYFTIPLS